MNIVLWIVQALLAIMFLLVGLKKTFEPLDSMAKSFRWVPSFPPAFVRFLGIVEILGAIGIILAPLTHILPWLAIAAAVGFIIVVVGGIVVHMLRHEYPVTTLNFILLALAAFVIYGRLVVAPF